MIGKSRRIAEEEAKTNQQAANTQIKHSRAETSYSTEKTFTEIHHDQIPYTQFLNLMKTAKAILMLSIVILSAIGLHTLNRTLRSEADNENERFIGSIDNCSRMTDARADPSEWIKCVKYSSGYAPLEGEEKYLEGLIAFNTEVRRKVVNAACNDAPITHYKKKGYINPQTYLISREPALVREDLMVQKLREAGIPPDIERTLPWNWAETLGASENLSKAIITSVTRDNGDSGRDALREYLEQLRLVIYRNNYKQEIKALCPQKLKDFNRKLGD